jgi:hypothetical protein
MAMQEIIRPCTRRRNEEGHDGRIMQYGRGSDHKDHAREEGPQFPDSSKGGLDKLIRIYGSVCRYLHVEEKKGAHGPVLIDPTEVGQCRVGYQSIKCRRAGELYLLEMAQKGMKVAEVKMLVADVQTEEDMLGKRRKLISVGSRAVKQVAQVYGMKTLHLLQSTHPMAALYMKKPHEKGPEGAISTLHRSRKEEWIIGGRALAESVRAG